MKAGRGILKELFPYHVGIFKRFPHGRISCITCPPGRADPLVMRVLWRALLPLNFLRFIPEKFSRMTITISGKFIPKNRTARILLAILFLLFIGIPALLYGLIAESFIETIATGKENMSSLISALLVLALISMRCGTRLQRCWRVRAYRREWRWN